MFWNGNTAMDGFSDTADFAAATANDAALSKRAL